MTSFLLTCALGGFLALGSVLLLLHFWKAPIGVDGGDHFRKGQGQPILRLGGLGVFLGFSVSTWVASQSFESLQPDVALPLILLCAAMFVVGFADDVRSVPAIVRLVAQIGIALAAYAYGFRIESIDLPVAPRVDLAWLSLPITVLWLISLPNIFNLSDGMDGLAGGLGVIVFSVIGTASLMVGNTGAAILAFTMASAIGGFLVFNLPPAKIYLGDGGAYLIGFYAALLTIQSSQKGTAAIVLIIVVAVLAYPLADTAFAICRRFVYGFPVFRADAEHLHHRMVTLGLPRGWLLIVFYLVFLCLAIGGLGMVLNRGLMIPASIGAIGIIGLGFFYTRAFSLHPKNFPDRLRRALRARRRVRYAIRLSQVLEHELDFTPDAEVFWKNFVLSLRKAGLEPVPSIDLSENESNSFTIELGTDTKWNLRSPAETTMSEWNWRKVAQCFLPSLSAALKRWPPSIEVGVAQQNDPAFSSDSSLNSKIDIKQSQSKDDVSQLKKAALPPKHSLKST